jgi:hypothetical protein
MKFRPIIQVAQISGLLLLVLALLQSCATLNRQQCQSANWSAIGYTDGTLGKPRSRFSRHEKSCQRFGVSPNIVAWTEGHKLGARLYCRPENAFSVGRRGEEYHNICEPSQHEVFMPVYNLGLREHGLTLREIRLEIDIDSYGRKIGELENQLRDGEIDQESANIAIQSLEDQKRSAIRDLGDAKRAVERFRQRLLRDGFMKMAL